MGIYYSSDIMGVPPVMLQMVSPATEPGLLLHLSSRLDELLCCRIFHRTAPADECKRACWLQAALTVHNGV